MIPVTGGRPRGTAARRPIGAARITRLAHAAAVVMAATVLVEAGGAAARGATPTANPAAGAREFVTRLETDQNPRAFALRGGG